MGDNNNNNMDVVDITDNQECFCCLKKLHNGVILSLNTCGHYMCMECSDNWDGASLQEGLNFGCPVCREPMETITVCVGMLFPKGTGSESDPVVVD